LDKLKADKIDNLFREKLQDIEISPSENYWPYLEKSLNKLSFFKFGWKHVNVYNASVGLLAVILPAIYFLNQPPENKSKKQIPVFDSSSVSKEITNSLNSNSEKPEAKREKIISQTKKKTLRKAEASEVPSSPELNAVVKDSIENKRKESTVIEMPEPVKIIEEKVKSKPKRIIYVVEQDTIIQKDTVKVRRKRRN
jgi:cytoskeletal protein RodZ